MSSPAWAFVSVACGWDRIRRTVDLGIGRGSRVGMGLPNSSGDLVSQLALMRVGAIPVLINTRLPIDRVRFMVADADVTAMIIDWR